jgi:hypothetical protein
MELPNYDDKRQPVLRLLNRARAFKYVGGWSDEEGFATYSCTLQSCNSSERPVWAEDIRKTLRHPEVVMLDISMPG